MKKAVLVMIVVVMGCLAASNALAQCCPAMKAAAKEAKPAGLCGTAGECGISAALAKVGLTKEQTAKIAAIRKETGCDQKPAEGACPKKLAAKKQECVTKIMAVLTEKQKAEIAKLRAAKKESKCSK